MIKEAIKFVTDLKEKAMEPKVVTIDNKTYCDKDLTRYDRKDTASAINVSTLTALVDYIKGCPEELREKMIIQIVSPSRIKLMSGLDEERNREYLMDVEADLPHFTDDRWMKQESFILELQAKFDITPDLEAILKVSGNIEAKTTANYGDDGITQKTTIKQGVVSKADVIVPNPVMLKPYRTFLEIEQPVSEFVFRIDGSDEPAFKLVDANGKLWVNEAKQSIKKYLKEQLEGISSNIVIIA